MKRRRGKQELTVFPSEMCPVLEESQHKNGITVSLKCGHLARGHACVVGGCRSESNTFHRWYTDKLRRTRQKAKIDVLKSLTFDLLVNATDMTFYMLLATKGWSTM